jgi:hypothetical protein
LFFAATLLEVAVFVNMHVSRAFPTNASILVVVAANTITEITFTDVNRYPSPIHQLHVDIVTRLVFLE